MGINCLKRDEEALIPKKTGKLFIEKLLKLGLINIARKDGNKIYFPSPFYIQEEHNISFKQIIETAILEQNLLFFPTIFEALIGITDFLETALELRKNFGLDYFFLIDFEKFFFVKSVDNSHFRLFFQDKSVYNPFEDEDISLKDESIMDNFTNGYDPRVKALIHSKIKVSEETSSINLNTMFYKKSREIFLQLKASFSYTMLEKFYFWSIVSFLYNYILKKLKQVNRSFDGPLNTCFNFLRVKIRQVLLTLTQNDPQLNKRVSYISRAGNNVDSQQLKILKEKLCYLYFNSKEFIDFRNMSEKYLSGGEKVSKETAEKIVSFKKLQIVFDYGKCDFQSEQNHGSVLNFTPDEEKYDLVEIELTEKKKDEKEKKEIKRKTYKTKSRKDRQRSNSISYHSKKFDEMLNEKNEETMKKEVKNKVVCLKCLKNLLYSSNSLPENLDNKIMLKEFLESFKNEIKHFPIEKALKYFFSDINFEDDGLYIFKSEGKIYLSWKKKIFINENQYREVDDIVN